MTFKFNPFQPNQMVTPGMFTGRIPELDTMEQALFQTKHGNPQHFLIEGERGIGKSSLLYLLSAIASGAVPSQHEDRFTFVVVSIDLGGVTTQSDIARAIARQLRAEISNHDKLKSGATELWKFLQKVEVMGVKYRGDNNQAPVDDFRDDLVSSIVSFVKGCAQDIDGVVILIDEADAPPESAGLGEFVKMFTDRLSRSRCNTVLLGLSGLPSTISKLRISHKSSPRVFEVMRLDPLEKHERAQVISRGLVSAAAKNGFQTTISTEALAFLCELSEGYPHFIQQFGYSAFDSDRDNNISMDDVLTGAYKENGAIYQLGSKYFDEMYYGKISSSEYRRVLNAMAKYSDGWVVRKTLVNESGVKETTLNNALNTLKAKNVIISDDTRQGYYRLPTKSFAAWINAINSVAQTGKINPEALFEEKS